MHSFPIHNCSTWLTVRREERISGRSIPEQNRVRPGGEQQKEIRSSTGSSRHPASPEPSRKNYSLYTNDWTALWFLAKPDSMESGVGRDEIVTRICGRITIRRKAGRQPNTRACGKRRWSGQAQAWLRARLHPVRCPFQQSYRDGPSTQASRHR